MNINKLALALISVTIMLALCLPSRSAIAQELSWRELAPEGEGFSVMMPTPVSQETSRNPQMPRQMMRNYSASTNDGILFTVSSFDTPSRINHRSPAIFNSLVAGFVSSYCARFEEQNIRCEVTRVRDLTLNGYRGRQFRISGGNESRSITGVLRIYLARDRFYIIQAFNEEGDNRVARFLASFNITSNRN